MKKTFNVSESNVTRHAVIRAKERDNRFRDLNYNDVKSKIVEDIRVKSKYIYEDNNGKPGFYNVVTEDRIKYVMVRNSNSDVDCVITTINLTDRDFNRLFRKYNFREVS